MDKTKEMNDPFTDYPWCKDCCNVIGYNCPKHSYWKLKVEKLEHDLEHKEKVSWCRYCDQRNE